MLVGFGFLFVFCLGDSRIWWFGYLEICGFSDLCILGLFGYLEFV